MNVNELRIGNYTKCTLDAISEINETCHIEDRPVLIKNEYFKVLKVDVSGDLEILIGSEPIEVELKELEPIPLTEEILLKCGLLKVNGNYLLGCYELIYDKSNERWNVWLMRGIIARIKYLHQLQNLYFALTNEELEITL